MERKLHPDFCIVGAPKCGTTALFTYLGQNPHIFLPSKKEPNFFCVDFPQQRLCENVASYLNLFHGAESHQKTGEGSVWYLYSDVALHNLAKHRPDVKILIMLRNPADAAYSLHAQKFFKLDDNVQFFPDAWELQSLRNEGLRIPATCRAPTQLQYCRVYRYSWQLKKAFSLFPHEQIKIMISEELFANPYAHLDAVCSFLNVPHCNHDSFDIVNPSRKWRYPTLTRAVRRQVARHPKAAAVGKGLVNAVGLKPIRWFERWNLRIEQRPPLDPVFSQRLMEAFSDDIGEVQELLRKDLSCWRVSPPRTLSRRS